MLRQDLQTVLFILSPLEVLRPFPVHYDLPYAARLCQICNSSDVESEEHFMSKCSKYKSLRGELHFRVNNWSKNAVPEQHVIEAHILKFDNPYVQKALAKYIFDAFNLRENQMGNKNIP